MWIVPIDIYGIKNEITLDTSVKLSTKNKKRNKNESKARLIKINELKWHVPTLMKLNWWNYTD